ncbi:hypothetical protein QBC46DRAFT_260996, partial [Diplogelasinospora grovesii]
MVASSKQISSHWRSGSRRRISHGATYNDDRARDEDLGTPTGSHDDLRGNAGISEGRGNGIRYPCPFRRRDPVRYNIRDHEQCAKRPLSGMNELRRHIRLHHRRRSAPYQCRRCKTAFTSETTLDDHLMRPKELMCEPAATGSGGNSEEGITDDMYRNLAGGNAGVNDGWTWDRIWKLIFPDDQEALSPDFYPVVELVEVEEAFNESQEMLKASIQETLRLLLPAAIDDHYCRFLAGQVELVFDTHRANVQRQCLSRNDSNPAATDGRPPLDKDFGVQQHGDPTKKQARRSRRSSTL